ncbi:MAG: 2-dehydro-3-deoxyphosphooctonate aldolase [Bacteroidales bacterium]|nr:2-dehydro-3-deoxyphosphooctonate aldolase [Bacteroidales bacterium]
MKKVFFIGVLAIICSCSSSKKVVVDDREVLPSERVVINGQAFLLTEISTDKSYGFTEKNPVRVGGVDKLEGPLNERRFLNALAGPNGEKVSYYRLGSCCPFNTDKGFNGKGLLDNYKVTWEGSKDTVSIYINMYDYGQLKAPVGFTIKK